MKVINVALYGQDFRELVAGQTVEFELRGQTTPWVVYLRITLSDIGWDVMRLAIDDAQTAEAERIEEPEDNEMNGG